MLEAFLVRLPRGARPTQAPLPYHCRAIAGVAKRHGHGDVLLSERYVAIPSNPRVTGVKPCHQRRSRRSADRAARIVLREANALAREAIERRRLKLRLTVRAQISIAEIVRLNEQDVRPGRLNRRLCLRQHRRATEE